MFCRAFFPNDLEILPESIPSLISAEVSFLTPSPFTITIAVSSLFSAFISAIALAISVSLSAASAAKSYLTIFEPSAIALSYIFSALDLGLGFSTGACSLAMSCLLGPIIFNAPSFNMSPTESSSIASAIECIDVANSKKPSLAELRSMSYNAFDSCSVDVANMPMLVAYGSMPSKPLNGSSPIDLRARPKSSIELANGPKFCVADGICAVASVSFSIANPAMYMPPRSRPLNPCINFCIFSIGLSAPNNPPMPSFTLLISEPPLNVLMPAPKAVIATPACAKFDMSILLKPCNALPIASITGIASAPTSINGSIGAISAIAPATANSPPAVFASPPPSTSASDCSDVPKVFNGSWINCIAMPTGISARPNTPIAAAPAIINGDIKLSPAAAKPNTTNPAANTPIVLNPTSFIKLSPNANGTTAAPNSAIDAAPITIPIEPLPNVFANKANPPIASVPFTNDVKSTSLNVLNPTAANPTDAPNSAIAAAPLSTLVSPNFLTASAIDCKKPPLLPPLVILPVIASAFVFSPPNSLPAFSPIDVPVLLMPFCIGPTKPPAACLAPPNSLSVIAPPTLLAPAIAFWPIQNAFDNAYSFAADATAIANMPTVNVFSTVHTLGSNASLMSPITVVITPLNPPSSKASLRYVANSFNWSTAIFIYGTKSFANFCIMPPTPCAAPLMSSTPNPNIFNISSKPSVIAPVTSESENRL